MRLALICCYYFGPFLVFLLWEHLSGKGWIGRAAHGKRRRTISLVIAVILWLGTLQLLFAAQAFHERDWRRANPRGPRTEEDLVALGDYPNVFAGWLLTGWIPVLVGALAARWVVRRRRWKTLGNTRRDAGGP